MKFAKMHGCSNDYIYVNLFSETVDNPSDFARKVSDRHYGIGSDGLILIGPSEKADFRMDMFNSDGSQGKMCGNGIRCVGKYVYDNGLTKKNEITIETLSGTRKLSLEIQNEKVYSVTVDMGEPITVPALIPVFSGKDIIINEPIIIDDIEYYITCISMGNPHCVVFVEDVSAIEIEKVGPCFEKHSMFPEGVNTEFIQITDCINIVMRVWERGAGETLGCGTGACAAVAAGYLRKVISNNVTVHLLGGELQIEYDLDSGHIFMTGPAVTVCRGDIEF